MLFTSSGQFWNIPIDVTAYDGEVPPQYEAIRDDLYILTVFPPNSEPRSFPAQSFIRTWSNKRYRCFYAGSSQGGSWGLLEDPDDSVIQGSYSNSRVDGIFDTEFEYLEFESDRCSS